MKKQIRAMITATASYVLNVASLRIPYISLITPGPIFPLHISITFIYQCILKHGEKIIEIYYEIFYEYSIILK